MANKRTPNPSKKTLKVPSGMEVVDGKNREANLNKSEHKKLEDLLVIGSMNPYGTFDETLFADKLDQMTHNEMQFLASRVGLVPMSDKQELRSQLEKSFFEFKMKSGGLIGGSNPQQTITPDNPHYDEIMKLVNG